MDNKTIKQIVTLYLIENKLDGLCNTSECGCHLDDIMPCDQPMPDCVGGYKCKFINCSEAVCIRADVPDKQTDCMEEEKSNGNPDQS